MRLSSAITSPLSSPLCTPALTSTSATKRRQPTSCRASKSRPEARIRRQRGKQVHTPEEEYFVTEHMRTYIMLTRRISTWRKSFALNYGREPTVDDHPTQLVTELVTAMRLGDLLRSIE
eukprot:jgi/Chlat1/5507/Chrsp360S00831